MNRFRLTCMAVVICFSTSFLSAQIDFRKFPMDSFRLPDIDRKALDISGAFTGGYTGLDRSNSLGKNSQYQIDPDFSAVYSRYINRPDIQAEYSVLVSESLRVSLDNFVLTSERILSNQSTTGIRIDGTVRKYQANNFIQYGWLASPQYFYNYERVISGQMPTRSKDILLVAGLAPTIGFGTGRLEPISDVMMALFILQDAVELGVDRNDISVDEVNAFAQRMAEVRNRRIFDSRISRIQELRDLYSFMLDHGWTIQDDPGFFTVLTDNWYSNIRSFRESGKRWSYLFTPAVSYSRSVSKEDFFPSNKSSWSHFRLSANIEFQKQKPVSLHKDHWRLHRLIASYSNDGPFFSLNPGNYVSTEVENSIGKNFYPNNRTVITTSVHADYTYYKLLSSAFQRNDQHVVALGLRGDFRYFISYRARFIANIFCQYINSTGGRFAVPIVTNFGTNAKASGISAQFNGSFIVSIF